MVNKNIEITKKDVATISVKKRLSMLDVILRDVNTTDIENIKKLIPDDFNDDNVAEQKEILEIAIGAKEKLANIGRTNVDNKILASFTVKIKNAEIHLKKMKENPHLNRYRGR